MRGVQFGRAVEYTTGVYTSVAMNRATVLEMHKSEAKQRIWYRLGTPRDAIVDWSILVDYDNGIEPSCAINNHNTAIEIHRTDNVSSEDLYYNVGAVSGGRVDWNWPPVLLDTGVTPQVAVNDRNQVVEVHQWSRSRKEIVYRVGQVDSAARTIHWNGTDRYDKGTTPSVAINNSGVVVEVHQSDGFQTLYYRIGDIKDGKINWRSGAREYTDGVQPSVAITDDGFVIEVHKSQTYEELWCRFGQIDGDSITWTSPAAAALYDDGERPRVACAGDLAIQTHQSNIYDTLWYSTSLITDRSKWMQQKLAVLGEKTLKQMTFPGSHNAAMYDPTDGTNRDQNITVYEQLTQGIRYFDLRPDWTGGNVHIHHDTTVGPLLQSVLNDVERFMSEGNRELVILKLSHYWNFGENEQAYPAMISQIDQTIGKWLFKRGPQDRRRLAEITLQEYLNQKGVVLVVSDESYFVEHKHAGIYVYRDASSEHPEEGDLVVYDEYADQADYKDMKDDQFGKFEGYNGYCSKKPHVPCDLFLLSWTLTGSGPVWGRSHEADAYLGLAMTELSYPNGYAELINIPFLDYTQLARPVDVCLSLAARASKTTEAGRQLSVGSPQ